MSEAPKSKNAVRSAQWRIDNPEKSRASALKHYRANRDRINAGAVHKNRLRKFGITRAEYEAILTAQGHVCRICRRPETATRNGKLKSLAVDHDHATGRVRGILCQTCNTLLGSSRDNIDVLRAAITYLEEHGSSSQMTPGPFGGSSTSSLHRTPEP